MGCNCGKRRQATPFAISPAPVPSEPPTPYKLIRPDGSEQEFPSKLQAYSAQLTEGQGRIEPVSQTAV